MEVIKRDGRREIIHFDKITTRIKNLCTNDELKYIDPILVAQKTIQSIYNGITTEELDIISAQICHSLMFPKHYLYSYIGARILISNLYKKTVSSFYETSLILYNHIDENNNHSPLINEKYFIFVTKHKDILDKIINHDHDKIFDYFGFKTLERAYLLNFKFSDIQIKTKKKIRIIERPQHMWMRVACGIHYNTDDINNTIKTYEYLSKGYFTHATPTLFNAGTSREQLASCFLMGSEDSMQGIYKTIFDCAMISKHAGGIGVHISNIRAKGSLIKGTNGISQGIVPMLKVYNETARYVDQGGGKRNGSIAIYLEPWHSDIMDFLDLKKNTGAETERARDLFLALWVPDLYMKILEKDIELNNYEKKNGKIRDEDFPDDCKWYLMCPNECPILPDVYGEEFEKLYYKYVREKKYRRWIRPIEIFEKIYESWIETGVPYISFKDHVNKKNNQKNSGIIKSSNLCVSGDTYILTDNGYIMIKDVVNEKVKIWNGNEFSEVLIVKTGENQKLVRVTLSNGLYLDCTEYHKFLLNNSKILNPKEEQRIAAIDLKIDDYITSYQIPSGYTNPFVKQIGKPAINLIEVIYNLQVTSIKYLDGLHNTYCFNEPKNNAGIFNGILTGQCNEINQISTNEEYAVCNLSSIAVNRFIKDDEYDFEKLKEIAYQAVFNLNRVIDINYYPVIETNKSNMKFRPVGLGIQGLADAFFKLRLPFESKGAMKLNKMIAECIYYGGLRASCDLAKVEGTYSEFRISPAAEGILQFDLWDITPDSGLCDWESLKKDIKEFGLRNSLITAMMPTASTSQILGNNECFEPITANMYYRSTSAGMFNMVNKYLVDDLIKLGLWNEKMKDMILYYNGSIQNIPSIPNELKELYKTVWEIKQKVIIEQSRDRGAYIDQSQSMNLFFAEPSQTKLLSAIIYAWKQGLKTGVYYIRTKSATNAIKFTIDNNIKNNIETLLKEQQNNEVKFCKIKNKGMTTKELAECESCSG
jgi:ribonucleotide reductase alpha subunit